MRVTWDHENRTTEASSRKEKTRFTYDALGRLVIKKNVNRNSTKFTYEDPIGFNGGDVNLYGYVRNNVLGKRDPLGLEECRFGFGYYCDYRKAADDYDYDLQTVNNTNRVLSNLQCIRKNSNYLYFEIDQIARHNLAISGTAFLGQASTSNPLPSSPDYVFEQSYDTFKEIYKSRLSDDREANIRSINRLYATIAEANSRNPRDCGCQLRN